jgi:cytosine/adenosine deaminase-related metal-dependent hydrolase
MKGLIPEKTGLVDFVFSVVTQRHFPDEETLYAICRAEDEMLANGIVAVGDICNNTLTLQQKKKERIAYHNFIEVSGWIPQIAQQRFERSKEILASFKTLERASSSLSPHAPYSVSNDLWNLISSYFKDNTITIHNQETDFEDALFKNGEGDFLRMYSKMGMDTSFFQPTGKSSLQSYLTKMNHAKNVLLVHDTFMKEEDIVFCKSNSIHPNIFFCLCVNANLYIEDALPPIELLRKNECAIVLGTDSLASNWQLDILSEIRTVVNRFPSISIDEILKWATMNGAKALQMFKSLGSFEQNKKPGVVLIANDLSKAERLI